MYSGNVGANAVISGESLRSISGTGSKTSANFFKVLKQQMEGWLTTLQDSQITEGEISLISGLASGSKSFGDVEEDPGKVVHEGSEAYLYASMKINDLSNLMTWIFNFISKENELYDKASNMLSS